MKTSRSPEVRHYFREHILDGIETNQRLRPRYKEITQGRSERIFRFLLSAEQLTLPLAYLQDRKTFIYQRSGIPLFRDEFLPMNQVEVHRSSASSAERIRIDTQKLWKVLSNCLNKDDWESFRSLCLKEIQNLSGSPEYSHLVRHLLESVYRCAYFLHGHEEEAQKKGLLSPKKVVKGLIEFQLWGFPGMALLDDWCEPLQRDGVPIFKNELPDLLADLNPSS